jgi:thiamine transport system permease protein
MADRAQPVVWFGATSVALILFLTLGTLGIVAWYAEGISGLRASDWAAIEFTLVQATLSAFLSVLLAIPVARALARRQFRGRGLIITLLGAPFILPVIVAVLGLIAVFGRSGILSQALGLFGLQPISIYGLQGVVLAHMFFNIPLATRLFLQGWQAIPSERFRLGASLGFRPFDTFKLLEWPMLRATVPGAFLVVFLICTTSFAVALAVGGGPKATTVELAIYQAFRFDFDFSKAATLGLIQFGICGLAAVLAFRFSNPLEQGAALERRLVRTDARSWILVVQDTLVIVVASLFLILPLFMILLNGLPNFLSPSSSVLVAVGRSIWVALASTLVTMILSLSLALLAVRLGAKKGGNWVESVGYLSIAASPLVIGTGLFLLIFPVGSPAAFALPITILVNAVMALPFAIRIITPAIRDAEQSYGRLADMLGLSGLSRLRLLIFPRIKRSLGFAAGLAAAMSMGDLGVIALFADPSGATLPLQLYRLMAAYRMDEAASAGLLLLLLSLSLFWLFDRGGRVNA